MTEREALKLALEALRRSRKAVSGDLDLAGCAYGRNDPDGHRYDDAKKALVTLDKAITAIKESLAQPEVFSKQNYLNGYCVGQSDLLAEQAKQEPAAWMVYTQDGQSVYVTDNPTEIQENQRALPMYTTPPQHKPLTDDEVEKIIKANMSLQMNLAGIRQDFEAAHGIKGEA